MMSEIVSPESALSLLRNRSMASVAQEQIEKLILSGDLPAGTRIGEAEMALRFGVSRGPIREALRALEEVGLVHFVKNRGVFVREIDLIQADQNYVVRGALEALAAGILAAKISADETAELRDIIRHMAKAVAADATTDYAELNLRLHRRIFEMAGNTKLIEFYGRITKELMLFRRRSLAPHPTLDEHRDIVEKIAAHDPAGAGEAIRLHVENARQRILATYTP